MNLPKIPIESRTTGVQILIHFLIIMRFSALYVSLKFTTKDKSEKIIVVICIEKGSKTVLTGDFNDGFKSQKEKIL